MNTPQPAIRPLPRRLGLIVGKSFIDMARLGERQEHITKEHGTVPFFRIPVTDSAEIILIERHGEHNELGAPQVAHLANMWTLAELFVEGAITTAASQAVEQPNTLLQIGDLGIVSSFQPFNVILLDAELLHPLAVFSRGVDATPYCPKLGYKNPRLQATIFVERSHAKALRRKGIQ